MNDTKHTSSIIQTGKKRRIRRPGSKKQRNMALFVIFVLIAAAVGAYFIFSPKEEVFELRTYTTAGVLQSTIKDTLEISGTAAVRFQTNILTPESGILESLMVEEGDWVEAGELVAVVDAEALENSLITLQKQLVSQTRNYERFLLQNELSQYNLDQQRDSLLQLLITAEEQVESAAELYSMGSATMQDVESAKNQLDTAQSNLGSFDTEQVITDQLVELDKLDHQDSLLDLQDSIDMIFEQIEAANIHSPIRGQVVTIIEEMAIGAPIGNAVFLMEIADTEQPMIESAIEEQYISYIAVGHPVVVSIAGQEIPGNIEKIGLSAQAAASAGTPTVALEIAIDLYGQDHDPDHHDYTVLPGSSALVELVLQEIPDALILPRGPFLTSGNRQYVYKVEGNTAQRVNITVGNTTETLVEILSGVSVGDVIITSSYHQFIDYETVTLGGSND
jgi:HlyD family secretion protein